MDEVESRGWGRRAPQSPSSSSFGAPQGNNKIYKCDVVFPIGEANKNDSSKTQFTYKKGFHPKGQNPFLILQVFEKLTP